MLGGRQTHCDVLDDTLTVMQAMVGAFAGIADIQGIDAYAAACAPTQLAVTKRLPLQYPYYYLRNARDNHAPNTMWGYSQLVHFNWDYQPNTPELVAQVAMVVLSGSKSLMLFQTDHAIMTKQNMSLVSLTIRSMSELGEVIRQGDINAVGFALSAESKLNEDVMVETILSPSKLLVVIVNTVAGGYSNLLCHVDLDQHWVFEKHTVSSLVLHMDTAPQLASVTNWTEVIGRKRTTPSGVHIQTKGATVHFSQLELDDQLVARFFVADVTFRPVVK